MASVSTDKRGYQRIQFVDKNGKPKCISLGRSNRASVEVIAVKVAALNRAAETGEPIDLKIAQWLASIGTRLHAKLAGAGLVPSRIEETETHLDKFIRKYVDGRTDVKQWSRTILHGSRSRLVRFFGANTPVGRITRAAAEQYAAHLRTNFAKATAARDIKRCRQFFAAACRAGLLGENPFASIKPGPEENPGRGFTITPTMAAKILANCPDAEWRAIFALARFGGLRIPSELQGLKWGDVDFDAGIFHVHSPKLEHTNKADRRVPLFPEVRKYLAEFLAEFDDQEPERTDPIFPWAWDRTVNLRTQFERIIKRAGLRPWERLFQNLRSTRQTELAQLYPIHAVCQWLGNSPAIAVKHYLQVPESEYAKAASTDFLSQFLSQDLKGCSEREKRENGPVSEMPTIPGKNDRSSAQSDNEGYPRQDSNL